MTLPKISVITPVRNGEKHIETCIKSVIAQDYPNLEFIILDAASTDGTVDIIKKYEKHITQWRSHKDDGPPTAVNEGIEKSTGEIIAILSADDWYEEGILRAVGEAFSADENLDVVACEARVVRHDEKSELQEIDYWRGKKLGLYAGAYPTPNARFYRKRVFDNYGHILLHDDTGGLMWACADREWLLRLVLHNATCKILPRLGYTHLSHDGSITFSGKYFPHLRHKRVRFREETVFMTERHLSLGHTQKTRRVLHAWHARACAYLFHERLREKNWAAAKRELKRGLRGEPLRTPFEIVRLWTSGRYKQV